MKNIKPFHLVYIAAILIVLGFGAWKFLLDKRPVRLLKYYGELNADSSFHAIPDFTFVDQLGRPVTNETFNDKIYVTDFFFTHCPSICPVMSNSLEELATEFKDEPQLKFLSHTVDPKRDSSEVLLKYANKHHANPEQWYFVTGDKKQLYDVARGGYLLSASEGDGGEEDFVHTQNMALVDKERHIRGFYSGIDKQEMQNLAKDIRLLLQEYKWKEGKN